MALARPGVTRLDWLRDAVAQETDECILWPFGTHGRGYGLVLCDGKREGAHRVALKLAGRPAPDGASQALHRCPQPDGGFIEVPGCVNKRHLRWGTNAENMLDASSRGAWKLTTEDVAEIRRRHVPGTGRRNRGNTALLAAEFGVSHVFIQKIVRGDCRV